MPELHESDIEQASEQNTVAERDYGRTGACRRCGLCCMIGTSASRTVKNGPNAMSAVLGRPDADGTLTPSDARQHKIRQGFLMGLETSSYWFWLRWEPCPYLDMGLSEADTAQLVRYLRLAHDEEHNVDWARVEDLLAQVKEWTCKIYETRPTSCQGYPPNNRCIWLMTRKYCGYDFPMPEDRHLKIGPEPEPEMVEEDYECAKCGVEFRAQRPAGQKWVKCTECGAVVLVAGA